MLQTAQTKKRFIILFSILPMAFLAIFAGYNLSTLASFLSGLQQFQFLGPLIFAVIYISCQIIYLSLCEIRKEPVHIIYHFISIIFLAIGIFLYFTILTQSSWSGIPDWVMNQEQYLMFFLTLYLPACFFHLFEIIRFQNQTSKGNNTIIFIGLAVGIPLSIYMLFTIILPLVRWNNQDNIGFHMFLLFLILVTFTFFYALLSLFYNLMVSRKEFYQRHRIWINLIINLILPLTGLWVYNLINRETGYSPLIFGDLSSPAFYIMAVLCGASLCVPSSEKAGVRLVQFLSRILFLPYTLYFMLMSLPFLPISMVLILAMGTGLLIMTPLLLTIIHYNTLREDLLYFKTTIPNHFNKIIGFALVAFLIMPAMYVADLTIEKQTVDEITQFLQGDHKITHKSLTRIKRILKHIESSSQRDFLPQPVTGFIYNNYVLENKILTDTELNRLNWIFDKDGYRPRISSEPGPNTSETIKLQNLTTSSQYNQQGQYWESWVDLSINNSNVNQNEYTTYFDIPEGAYIQDYYLDIDGRREKGLLVEKRAAIWIYNRIVRSQRDPGILYYHDNNTVRLSVFPFNKNQNRTTGFKLIHKNSITLNIDGTEISLGKNGQPSDIPLKIGNSAFYFSSAAKSTLTETQRNPEYYLVVDQTSNWNISDFEKIIGFIQKEVNNPPNLHVVLADYQAQQFSTAYNWKKDYQHSESALFLDKVVSNILTHHLKNKTNTVPAIIFLGSEMDKAVQIKLGHEHNQNFPELDTYYVYETMSSLKAYDFQKPAGSQLGTNMSFPFTFAFEPVKIWTWENQQYYLTQNSDQILNLAKETPLQPIEIPQDYFSSDSIWEKSAILNSLWLHNPQGNSVSEKLPFLIFLKSLDLGILTPYNSYIALETEEQKKALLKKQKEMLEKAQNNWSDGEELTEMSEPAEWIWLIVFAVMGAVYYKKKRLGKRSA